MGILDQPDKHSDLAPGLAGCCTAYVPAAARRNLRPGCPFPNFGLESTLTSVVAIGLLAICVLRGARHNLRIVTVAKKRNNCTRLNQVNQEAPAMHPTIVRMTG